MLEQVSVSESKSQECIGVEQLGRMALACHNRLTKPAHEAEGSLGNRIECLIWRSSDGPEHNAGTKCYASVIHLTSKMKGLSGSDIGVLTRLHILTSTSFRQKKSWLSGHQTSYAL